MRKFLPAVALIGVLLFCVSESPEFQTQNAWTGESRPIQQEYPAVNLPEILRQKNWGGGSCVHASLCSLLRWQNKPELAEWWRRQYAGGESSYGLMQKLDRAGVTYAATTEGDIAFLDWACETRRGAIIFYYPNHCVTLVHLDDEWAAILDNNRTGKYIWIPRDKFIQEWRGYGGVAGTLLYAPAPPLPYVGG